MRGERRERARRCLEPHRRARPHVQLPGTQRLERDVDEREADHRRHEHGGEAPGEPAAQRRRGVADRRRQAERQDRARGREQDREREGGNREPPPAAREAGVLARDDAVREDAEVREQVRVREARLRARERPRQEVAAGADERREDAEAGEHDADERGECRDERRDGDRLADRRRHARPTGEVGRHDEERCQHQKPEELRPAAGVRRRHRERKRRPADVERQPDMHRAQPRQPPLEQQPQPPREAGEREQHVAPARVLVDPRKRQERRPRDERERREIEDAGEAAQAAPR